MSTYIHINLWQTTYACTLETFKYGHGGNLGVQLFTDDGEPYATVSVNMPRHTSEPLEEDEFYVKNWGENEGLIEQLVAQHIIEPVDPPKYGASGFISTMAYRLVKPKTALEQLQHLASLHTKKP